MQSNSPFCFRRRMPHTQTPPFRFFRITIVTQPSNHQRTEPTLKTFHFIIGIVICICELGLSLESHAQTPSAVEKNNEAAARPVRLQGLVTDRKKYSFTVRQDETEYTVKLGDGAPVGLKMNKPWFDWENEQVVVDAVRFPTEPTPKTETPPKRVAVKLPAKQLYLISRLGDAARIKEVMAAEVKRLNFYLVTPDDPGPHFPTDEDPYLSGSLSVKDQVVRVEVNQQSLPVKLGFRYATMNGFSIVELVPGKTEVFLSGLWGEGEREILATSILFQPVIATASLTSSSNGRPQPVANQ